VLNNPAYAGAKVLVAGSDFGCGSSREHAVWALRDYGFDVVLAPKFADIFRGNSGKQGLLTATISEADAEKLWSAIEANPGVEVTVDLVERRATLENPAGDIVVPIEVDDYTRWRLLEGLDDIALTLRDEDAISTFEKSRASWRPQTLPARHA
jgi:3-isopropylmalate/(R)-2-methylmalate dehydratase small subunit